MCQPNARNQFRPFSKVLEFFNTHFEPRLGPLATPCHVWTGSKCRKGYGDMTFRAKHMKAHRFSWFIHHGEIPEGMCVCHDCDNPSCVNVAHLFIGTNCDNVQDRVRKGRSSSSRGEKQRSAKLTEFHVRMIRDRYANGDSYRRLSKNYGVNIGTIAGVVKRKTWKHVA